jgi:hypothetical protein
MQFFFSRPHILSIGAANPKIVQKSSRLIPIAVRFSTQLFVAIIFPRVSNHVNIILMEYFFQGESKELLFLTFEKDDFCVLQWDAEVKALVCMVFFHKKRAVSLRKVILLIGN